MSDKRPNRFTNTLPYNWPFYLVFPVIGGLCIAYLFNVRHQPQPYEKIDIFVAAPSVESQPLCDLIYEKYVDNGLKLVTTTQSNPSDSVFAQKLRVVGYSRSDLFILPHSVLESISPAEILLPYSDDFVSANVADSNSVFYIVEDVRFGILLKDDLLDSWLEDYIDFNDEDYYLCLNATSKNIGDEGIYNNPEYDLALKVFAYLLGDAQ